MSLCRTCTKDY